MVDNCWTIKRNCPKPTSAKKKPTSANDCLDRTYFDSLFHLIECMDNFSREVNSLLNCHSTYCFWEKIKISSTTLTSWICEPTKKTVYLTFSDKSTAANYGFQTRGPRAACGPREHFVRPGTRVFLEFSIN